MPLIVVVSERQQRVVASIGRFVSVENYFRRRESEFLPQIQSSERLTDQLAPSPAGGTRVTVISVSGAVKPKQKASRIAITLGRIGIRCRCLNWRVASKAESES